VETSSSISLIIMRTACPVFTLLVLPLSLGITVSWAGPAPAVQAPIPVTTTNSRPCSANPVLAPSRKSKSAKQSKHPLPVEPLPSCVEVKGQPIDVQEFLQSVVREFQWHIGENHASEDTWTFVRYLNDEELSKCSDTKVLIEPVKFIGGKAAVLVRTTELADGYVRVQISTHIQGEGKSTDKVSAQPGTSWPILSTGSLEQDLIHSLQSRYKPV
jgi:hypothetical protein